ncbi:EGF family domain-containing protein [Toxoplasma gondii MAS]|uniref:EGF family domain-containing protein n=1 Tax=Toxoplasma gondii MAS TaxID=943118 RepID=A0A086PR38_TOXGO|nr:EGF family domain-containing protein [Toxoplasma gondii MAS]
MQGTRNSALHCRDGVPSAGAAEDHTRCPPLRFSSGARAHFRPTQVCLVAPLLALLGALFTSVSGFRDLPSQSEWLCRISESGQRCGDVYANEVTQQKGGICRAGDCCARTAIGSSGMFGDICTSDEYQCRHHKDQFSFGKCDLKNQCHRCSKNSRCHQDNSENGGVWCQCPPGGEGSGITCKVDPCKGNPCNNGICLPKEDDESAFECQCYPGYTLMEDSMGRYRACVDYCGAGVCGEGALRCLNGESRHMCICKEGYVNQTLNGFDTCVPLDLCSVQPCGKPEAVVACKTTSTTTYTCECQVGFKETKLDGRPYCAADVSN